MRLGHVRDVRTGAQAATPAFVPGGKRRAELGWGCKRGGRGRSVGRERRGRAPGPLGSQRGVPVRLSDSGSRGFHALRDAEQPSAGALPRPGTPLQSFRAGASTPATRGAVSPRGRTARVTTAAREGAKRRPRFISRGSRCRRTEASRPPCLFPVF